MDYYANESLGPWTVNNAENRPIRTRKLRGAAPTTKGQPVGGASREEPLGLEKAGSEPKDKCDLVKQGETPGCSDKVDES